MHNAALAPLWKSNLILRSRRARVRLCASVLGSTLTGDLGAAACNEPVDIVVVLVMEQDYVTYEWKCNVKDGLTVHVWAVFDKNKLTYVEVSP